MKPKQLLTLLVIAAILGILAAVMNSSSESSWSQQAKDDETASLISEDSLDVTKVASVTITSPQKSITLKNVNGIWQLAERNGYPANMDNIKSFIMSLTDSRIARTLTLSDAQKTELKLTKDSGATTVVLADATGKELKSLILGVEHTREMEEGSQRQNMFMMGGNGPVPDGRFVLIDNSPVLVANTFHGVDSDAPYWLNKDFFKIENLKEATLSADGKTVWAVSRKDKSAELALAGVIPAGKEADSSKLSSIKSAFSWIHFNDVAALNAKPADIGFDKMKIYTAKDFDGFTYVVHFGAEVNGKRYMKLANVTWNGALTRTPGKDEKPEDKAKLDADFAKSVKDNKDKAAKFMSELSKWTYEVSSYTLANIDKSFTELLKDKPAEAKPAEAKPAEANPAVAKPAVAKPAVAKPAVEKK